MNSFEQRQAARKQRLEARAGALESGQSHLRFENPFPAHGQALAALMSRKGTYLLCAAAPMTGAASCRST